MCVVCIHVCSRTVKSKTGDDARRQILEVFKLIHEYKRPELWTDIKDLILDNGKLDVRNVLTRRNIKDLVYVISKDVAAKHIKKLKFVTFFIYMHWPLSFMCL